MTDSIDEWRSERGTHTRDTRLMHTGASHASETRLQCSYEWLSVIQQTQQRQFHVGCRLQIHTHKWARDDRAPSNDSGRHLSELASDYACATVSVCWASTGSTANRGKRRVRLCGPRHAHHSYNNSQQSTPAIMCQTSSGVSVARFPPIFFIYLPGVATPVMLKYLCSHRVSRTSVLEETHPRCYKDVIIL